MGIIITTEKMATVVEDMLPLWEEHYEEIANNKSDIKLNPWFDFYKAREADGSLRIVTVRSDHNLLGYLIMFINPHPHYVGSLTAFVDIFYIKTEHRNGSLGIRLIKFAMATAKQNGVQRFIIGCKVEHDLGILFHSIGFTHVENLHEIIL